MYGETKKNYETKKKSFVTLIPAKVQAAASKLTGGIRYLQQQYPKSPSPTLHTFLTLRFQETELNDQTKSNRKKDEKKLDQY